MGTKQKIDRQPQQTLVRFRVQPGQSPKSKAGSRDQEHRHHSAQHCGKTTQNAPFFVSGLYQASLGPLGLGLAGQMLLPANSGENHFCIFTV
jgi:hypothetical protein